MSDADTTSSARTLRRKGAFRSPFVWAFFVGIVLLTLMRPLLRFEPDPPPVLAELPAWTLVDQHGSSFGSADLEGTVYVANFFFTRCASICPPLMRAVATLDDRYEREGIEGIRIVSITVDPEADTAERLGEYGKGLGADPARWTLLTGEPDDIRKLVVSGFKTAMGDREELSAGLFDIAHAGKLVLVDGQGRIRGYYDYDAPGLDELFHRSQHVQRER
jgi:protein SCO1/2